MSILCRNEVLSTMKVFISWSEERSKKVAVIFRDWLPTVIQVIEPFVSSEDIDKGSRWNSDISQELKETSFGLICVTKDNINAPWLNFEAGTLSKTIANAYVAPILFDVKPSDLTSSPLSQFQATSLTRDDMKRLIETLNAATGNCLAQPRLDKAFNLCYPDLEKSLQELRASGDQEPAETQEALDGDLDRNILEELLETARNTQRLLGNTDSKLYTNIDQVQKKVDTLSEQIDRQNDITMRRSSRRIRPMLAEDILLSDFASDASNSVFPYNVLMVLGLFKDELPWLYDAGSELVRVLTSKANFTYKRNAAERFRNITEHTFSHPAIRDPYLPRKDVIYILRDLPMYVFSHLERAKEHGGY